MDFSKELTEFSSTLHSSIYNCARGLMPLSRTLDAVTDPVLRESCVALHGFVTDMLSDMYDYPEAYYLPIMKAEEFLSGKPLHVVKHEFPNKIKKIYSQTGHAASSYMDLLCRIGKSGKFEGDVFIVSEENLQYIGKRVSSSISPIKLDKRLEALSRVGFMTEVLPSRGSRFFSRNYPNMFSALCALPNDNFSMLDFRNIKSICKLTHEDFFEPLITEQRERAYELHDFAMKYKMRPATDANGRVVYQYKGKQVIRIGKGNDYELFLDVRVIGKDRKDEHTVIDKYLEKESENFQKQALRHMTGCDANQCLNCSTYASGWYVTVLGKRHQMCGEGIIGYAWRKPIESDITIIKRLIEIRCEIIDEAL